MAAVSETIVREFFELHGFFVQQPRKYVAPSRREEDEVDFLVINPAAKPGAGTLPFVLGPEDMPFLSRAIVAVKGWHTESFSAGVLTGSPEIFRFVAPAVLQRAQKAFGDAPPPTRILVVPALPQSAQARNESIELLRRGGVEAILPFRSLLAGLIDKVETNRNYQKSDLLQMLRILKTYDLFRETQLELFKPRRRRTKPS